MISTLTTSDCKIKTNFLSFIIGFRLLLEHLTYFISIYFLMNYSLR